MSIKFKPELRVLNLNEQQKKAKAISAINMANQNAYRALSGAFTNVANVVWNNPDGLTPQQVLDAAGTDAAKLFAVSNKLIELFALIGENVASPVPDGVTVIINQDGTVTLS